MSAPLKKLIAATEIGDARAAAAAIRADSAILRDPRPLLKATRRGDAALVAVLLDAGADPNRASRGDTPLHAAAWPSAHAGDNAPSRGEIVARLITAGADFARRGSWLSVPPLHAAAFGGSAHAVQALRDAGAPVDVYAAAALGDVTAVAAHPDAVAARDPSGLGAIHFAAGSRMSDDGCLAVLRHLLDRGADPNAVATVDARSFSPAYFAISAHSLGRTQLLLERGAEPRNALAVALWNGTDALIELAWSFARSADVLDGEGRPVLVELIRWGQLGRANWMLEHGANPNLCAADGWTPLHAAGSRGAMELVIRLLALGADPHAVDRDGHSPLDLARANGRGPIAEALAARPKS